MGHLWHGYQPPTQDDHWYDIITGESYRPVAAFLARQDPSRFKATVNWNASLTEALVQRKQHDVIENLGVAAQKGVIEFVDSGAYHPLFPLLIDNLGQTGVDIANRQIELNRKINCDVFKGVWKCRGFFPPEMAFSRELSRIIKSQGYEWAITESFVYDSANTGRSIPYDHVATIEGLPVFFRSKHWSKNFAMAYPDHPGHDIKFPWGEGAPRRVEYLTSLPKEHVRHAAKDLVTRFARDMRLGLDGWFQDGYIITAYDWETIGHHHAILHHATHSPDALDEYVTQLHNNGFEPSHISEFLDLYPGRESLDDHKYGPLRGSWSTDPGEVDFPLWQHPDNPIHRHQWALLGEVARRVPQTPRTANDHETVALADKMYNSCGPWWAAINPKALDNIKAHADLIMKVGERVGYNNRHHYDAILAEVYRRRGEEYRQAA